MTTNPYAGINAAIWSDTDWLCDPIQTDMADTPWNLDPLIEDRANWWGGLETPTPDNSPTFRDLRDLSSSQQWSDLDADNILGDPILDFGQLYGRGGSQRKRQ